MRSMPLRRSGEPMRTNRTLSYRKQPLPWEDYHILGVSKCQQRQKIYQSGSLEFEEKWF